MANKVKEGMVVELTLPVPPSSNRYWRNFRGRTVVSKEATEYKNLAGWAAREQGVDEVMDGDVAMTIRFYRGRKAGDLSNRIKVLEDALQGVIYNNDSQVVELHAYRYDDKNNPRMEVQIRSLEEMGK